MWEWVPKKSLGDIELGASIGLIKSGYDLLGGEYDSVTGWTTYYLPDHDIYIDTENDNIICITSYRDFFYKNQNIIGINILLLGETLGVLPDEVGEPVEYEDGEVKTPREYFELGLQVWMSRNVVSSVSCSVF